jgi:hypothetical protein
MKVAILSRYAAALVVTGAGMVFIAGCQEDKSAQAPLPNVTAPTTKTPATAKPPAGADSHSSGAGARQPKFGEN